MSKPDYEADKEKYGESDLRIKNAGKDPKKLSEAAKKHPDYNIGEELTNAWEGTKEFKDPRNPLHWGHNVGAVGARGIEMMVPQNREELMFELMTLGSGKKIKVGRKLAHAALKDIPLYQKGEKYVSDLIEGIWNQSRLKPAYEGAKESIFQMSRSGANEIPGKPSKMTGSGSIDDTLSASQKRNWAKYERDEAAYFLEERWPRDKEFNELGDLIKKELKTLYPDIPLSSWRRHHTNPLKQGAQLLNGLKPQYRKEAVQIMFRKGLSAGHNPKQLALIPHKIHTQIHNFINKRIGKDTVAILEKKWLKPGQKIENIPWPERQKIIMDYAKTVKESNEKIYDMMTAIAVNKKHGPSVLPEVLAKLNSKVDATDVGLDDLLKQVKIELNLQEISGTVPKIDVRKLAEKYSKNPSIQEQLLQDLTGGMSRKELKRKYPGFNTKQLGLFD